jgi:hypothetical protein
MMLLHLSAAKLDIFSVQNHARAHLQNSGAQVMK